MQPHLKFAHVLKYFPPFNKDSLMLLLSFCTFYYGDVALQFRNLISIVKVFFAWEYIFIALAFSFLVFTAILKCKKRMKLVFSCIKNDKERKALEAQL